MAPKFSLQNVLDIRHSKVEALEVALSRLLMAQLNLQTRVHALEQGQAALMQRLAEGLVGEVDLFAVQRLRADCKIIDEALQNAHAELAEMDEKVDLKRRELVAAKQDEETLEILKRKRIEQFNAEVAQVELRVQDDIYIAQAFRQRPQQI